MLKFLGSGGAFNTKRGNNCAYMELGTELFLFDLGEDVFQKLIDFGLFEKKTKVNIFITHLHGDHVGGLGTTIAYLYYKVFHQDKSKINVYFPSNSITELLELQGVSKERYTFYINRWDELIIDGYPKSPEYIFDEANHSKSLDYFNKTNTFSIEFIIPEGEAFYYSGDTNEYKERLKNLWNFNYVYHEVTMNKEVKAHLSYDKLLEATKDLPKSEKKKIILMHLDEDFDEEMAKGDGYSVATNMECDNIDNNK